MANFIVRLLTEFRSRNKPGRDPRETGTAWIDAQGVGAARTRTLVMRDEDGDVPIVTDGGLARAVDVDLNNLVDGQILISDGGVWKNGNVGDLDASLDVLLTDPQDHDLLTYDAGTWVNTQTPQVAGLGIGTAGVANQITLLVAPSNDLMTLSVSLVDYLTLDAGITEGDPLRSGGFLVRNYFADDNNIMTTAVSLGCLVTSAGTGTDVTAVSYGLSQDVPTAGSTVTVFNGNGGMILGSSADVDPNVATFSGTIVAPTLTRDSGDLTISTTTSGAIDLNPLDHSGTVMLPGSLQLHHDVGTLSIVAGDDVINPGSITLEAKDGTLTRSSLSLSNNGQTDVSAIGADLTLSTTTSGDLVLNPADNLKIGSTAGTTGTVVVPTVGTLHFTKGIYTGLT